MIFGSVVTSEKKNPFINSLNQFPNLPPHLTARTTQFHQNPSQRPYNPQINRPEQQRISVLVGLASHLFQKEEDTVHSIKCHIIQKLHL